MSGLKLARREVSRILRQYGKAWESADRDATVRLFTQDATYQEFPFDNPLRGRDAIGRYWGENTKAQRDIHFKAGQIFVVKNSFAAEWSNSFTRATSGARVELRGVMIVRMNKGKIASFREYWHRKEEDKSPLRS